MKGIVLAFVIFSLAFKSYSQEEVVYHQNQDTAENTETEEANEFFPFTEQIVFGKVRETINTFIEEIPYTSEIYNIEMEINEGKPLNRVDVSQIPNVWCSLKKLNGKFYHVYSCDGFDKVYKLSESSIQTLREDDFEVDLIDKIEISANTWVIKLKTSEEKSLTKSATLTIGQTIYPNIYYMKYDNGEIAYYDLIVALQNLTPRMEFKVNCDDSITSTYESEEIKWEEIIKK